MESLLPSTQKNETGREIAILKAEGSMDVTTVDRFEADMRELMDKKIFRIVINMKGLRYISSAGIGILMANIRQIQMKHGDIKLTNVSPDIYRIFELLELQDFFQILKTDQDAIDSFGQTA
jgi:anti-anti-sigma factor